MRGFAATAGWEAWAPRVGAPVPAGDIAHGAKPSAASVNLAAFLRSNGWLVGHPALLLRQTRYLSDSPVSYPDLFLVHTHYFSDSLAEENVRDPDLVASQSDAVN